MANNKIPSLGFHHIALRVKDFEASLKFYTTLTKLQIAKQFSANGGNVAYLQNAAGETEINLCRIRTSNPV